jgi:hypothetical protein
MTKDIIELKNISFDSFFSLKEKVLNNNFPWCWRDSSTTEKFPYLIHNIKGRNESFVNSNYENMCLQLFSQLTMSVGFKVKKITRMAINLALNCGQKNGDFHIDDTLKHKIMIVYFNKPSIGNTLICKKKYDKKNTIFRYDTKMEIQHTVLPEENKAVIFDGLRYHSAIYPSFGERRVSLVVNFVI